jgi:membrane protein
MMKKFRIKDLGKVLKSAGSGFVDHNVIKLSASLAFYTIFSMGPLLLIIISICSFFYGRAAVEGKIYYQLQGFLGHDTALSLQQIIKNAAIGGKTKFATIIGGVALLIGATSIFAEMQDSINTIWELKVKPNKGWLTMIINRLLSFSVIISLGFLLLVSLSITALIEGFSDHLRSIYPQVAVIIFYVVNLLITFLITAFIFAIIFKVLPDAKIKWKDVSVGAVVTALLFMLGKFGISFYISKSNVGTTYGTTGSLVVLLLWVYYSSFILYFGAEFTKSYALIFGSKIYPSEYAVSTQHVEMEVGNSTSINEKEKITKKESGG